MKASVIRPRDDDVKVQVTGGLHVTEDITGNAVTVTTSVTAAELTGTQKIQTSLLKGYGAENITVEGGLDLGGDLSA